MAQKPRENPKSTVDAATKASDIRQPQIPDSVIEQILEVTQIPVGRRDEVFLAVQSCVESFADSRLGEHKSCYEMIALACHRLLRDISKLNNLERQHFGADLQDLEGSLARIRSAATGLIPPRRPRHRPRGSVAYPHIEQLVYDLHVIAGDKLTLYRDAGKAKGSLQAILDILHALSSVIFPSISFNTLNKMRRWANIYILDDG